MSMGYKVTRPIGAWLRDYIPWGRTSYSQEGEDIVLARILSQIPIDNGFYVDVGAHHPTRYSNTYYFYRRGWRGINVDALPGTQRLFRRVRPRDITIECGIGDQAGLMPYYVFNEPALNTFSEREARQKDHHPYHLVKTIQVPLVPLRMVLAEHMPPDTRIDFLTIDAEGFDHEVVMSNDWDRFRPKVVLVELLGTELEQVDAHPTAMVLRKYGYRLMAKTFNTYFFASNESFPRPRHNPVALARPMVREGIA